MMFRAALAFFTRLPVGAVTKSTNLQGLIVWLPVVGLVIGVLVAFGISLATLLLPASLCGLLGCLMWVLITGGLHLDGAADCGDGLIVEASPEKRLEIMKDPCLGTFGAVAVFFVLACKALTLATLASAFSNETWWTSFFALSMACSLAAILARCMVFIAMRRPSARPDGLGQALLHGLKPEQEHKVFAFGLAFILFFCLTSSIIGFKSLSALWALGVGLLVTYALLATAKKRLGGVTGDVFGCLIELVECVVLIVLCANLIKNFP